MRTIHGLFAAAFAVACAGPAFAAEEHRELGPHEHGHGTLDIAVEGKRVLMALVVPGADIVGFEHQAGTDEQKAAVAAAKAKLADALSVFKLPAAAGCTLAEAKVEVKAEDDADAKQGGEAEHHSEFHAEYAIDCAAPEKVTTIEFKYFALFPGAQELDVNVATEKGQSKFEVTREQPKLEIG